MKPISMSLSRKALLAVIIILLPVIYSYIDIYRDNREHLKATLLDDLAIIAEAYEGQVYHLFDSYKRRAEEISRDITISSGLERILEGDKTMPDKLNNYMFRQKSGIGEAAAKILALSPDGIVKASSDVSLIGKNFLRSAFFLKGSMSAHLMEGQPGADTAAGVVASAPVVSPKTGVRIGVVAIFFNLVELDKVMRAEFIGDPERISWSKGRRETFEAYLVNSEKLMITGSRFISEAILKQQADTLPVRECLNAKKEIADFYEGYRGVRVAGASMCLPGMGWTLLAEIDEDEATAVTGDMLSATVRSIAIVAGIILIMFVFYFRGVLARLRTMASAASSIARGEYSVTVPVKSRDEIGVLAAAFNTMSDAVQRTMEQVRESEKKLQAIVDNSATTIYLKGTDGAYLMVNRHWEAVFNIPRDKIYGKTVYDIFPKSFADRLTEVDKKVLSTLGPVESEDMLPQSDGYHFYITVKFPLLNAEGRPFAICGISTDITERKRLEDARLELQGRYTELLDNLSVGVFRRESGGRFIEANNAAVKILEAGSGEELSRHGIDEFFRRKDEFKELQERLSRDGFVKREEVEIITLRGRGLWCHLSAALKKDRDGAVYVDGIIEDITAKKMLEEQLRNSQKMEAVGLLAGGVAHDFNNILTAIIAYGNIIIARHGSDSGLRGYIDQILLLSDKAVSLIRDLLTFSRKQPVEQQSIGVNEIVKRVEGILRRLIGENIEFSTRLAEQDVIINVDPVQIEHVLMNLATNARDAMPEGGRLTIETGLFQMGRDFIDTHGYGIPGNYAVISFSDTGSGMDDEVKQKIFEPFFTTKEVGKGTGLGLSTAYGIIKQHRGFIDVISARGKGAEFRIYLPVSEYEPGKTNQREHSRPHGGSETILLAEDDAGVRSAVKSILNEYGYRVIESADGEDAVSKFTTDNGNIQLLIMDAMMPKKSGREAYEEIKKIREDIRVIFISGYTPDIINVKDLLLERSARLLSKPVSPNELLRMIRDVLGN